MGLQVTRSKAGAVVFFLIAVALILVMVLKRAESTLRESKGEATAAASIQFTESVVHPGIAAGAELLRGAGSYRDTAEFGGRLYLGGASGLTVLAADGARVAEYRVGFELPPAEVIALRARGDELLIATDGEGLLNFNGRQFRSIRPRDAGYRHLTALLPLADGRVLMGTAKAGVLVYDGKRVTRLDDAINGEHITALAGEEADVWIGTLQHGAFRWHAGQMDHFMIAEGLPDAQVLSLAAADGAAYVGTPLGVAEFRGGRFTRVLAAGYLAKTLDLKADRLLVGTEDEGTLDVRLEAHAPASPALGTRAVERLPDAAVLTDRNISALAVEPGGRTWIGYFDRGLDLLDPAGEHVQHIEDEHLFCVNRIVIEAGVRTAVATANGLVLFDASGRQRQVLGRADGLIANHVTDVMLHGEDMVIATPAGLTFADRAGMRSMYAFQGLVNNHAYTLGGSPAELMVGTLGGLSVLQDGVVSASYTTMNSRLKHNWITAVAMAGDEWFVGTYGAGVLRFKAGEWSSFADLPKELIVNPNALLVTSTRVVAGSLGQGLFSFDRASRRWTAMTTSLPSLNVTALAESGSALLIGTDNGLVRMPEQDLP